MSDYRPDAQSSETMTFNVNQMNKNLYKALAKAQSEFPIIPKNNDVGFGGRQYKYADLGTMIASVTPKLALNGLSVHFLMESVANNMVVLKCFLAHESGESIHSEIPLPLQTNPQQFGSHYTYYRRYLLGGLLNLSEQEDDDGTVASEGPNRSPDPQKSDSSAPSGGGGIISEPQRKRLYAMGKKAGFTDDQLKAMTMSFGYESSKDIKKSDYQAICDEVERGPKFPQN